MGCLEKRPKSYSSNWVDSWPRNWKNQFTMCTVGLTDELRYQSCDRIIWACFAALAYLVLCGSASPTGSLVLVWDWRNKFCAELILHQNNLVQPTARFYPPPVTCAVWVAHGTRAQKSEPNRTIGRRIDQDWMPTYVWARRGTTPTAKRKREKCPGPHSRRKEGERKRKRGPKSKK